MFNHHHHEDKKASKDPKKEMKHHKQLEHLGQAVAVAAGAYARVRNLLIDLCLVKQ